LRAALVASQPFLDRAGFKAFDARQVAGVDLTKLIYFGGSVFWRATLDGWNFGKRRYSQLVLGPYAEKLRLFLLGVADFPSKVLLVITVSEKQTDLINRNMALPYGGNRTADGYHYQFVIPGITFLAIVGGGIPHDMRAVGTSGAGFIFIAEEADTGKLRSLVSATREAPRRGKLAQVRPKK
jgi:hypothetical protein